MKKLIFEVNHSRETVYFYDDGTYKFSFNSDFRKWKVEDNKLYFKYDGEPWEEWLSYWRTDIMREINNYIAENILLGENE